MTNITMQYRMQYDRDSEEYFGELAKTENHEPSLTKQEFKDEVDINVMMDRMGVTDKELPTEVKIDPRAYGNYVGAPDFRTIMDVTRDANNKFNALPAKIRNKFNNDPSQLWAFMQDPENRAEALRMGFVKEIPKEKPPEPEATKTPET